MGMAASQARLLTITARMHDVEYKAQSIQNAKIQLSTQSDQVYQEYLEALDATTLTVDDINGNTITANFNNLVGKNGVETGNNYALRTSNGQLIVEDDVKDAYDEYDGNDPYEFAMMMIYGDAGNALDRDNLEDCENQVFENNSNIGSDDMNSMIAVKEKMEKILTDNGVEDYNDLTDEAKDEYDELEQAYKYKLYKNFGSEILLLLMLMKVSKKMTLTRKNLISTLIYTNKLFQLEDVLALLITMVLTEMLLTTLSG